ncbi:hypothetical protein [Mycolicibacterium fortuitum]|uniref:hypothetical protein n=1 Tax=Mycolicibacterium fortuitum TaxID=1766 RepID=UPI001CE1A7A7|nr:hypothetical protein [Mycolicibacterium fortuitum]MCA4727148.1 hypothetical protein [Mycolicibacterium fortuitum]
MTMEYSNDGSRADILSWRPPDPLTVVVAAADVTDFANCLTSEHGWWYFQRRMSANGINIDAKAETAWEEDPSTGTAWVALNFTGYHLACDLRRQTARDIAAALTGESPIAVPVLFTCEPWDEDWLTDPVPVYFRAEQS